MSPEKKVSKRQAMRDKRQRQARMQRIGIIVCPFDERDVGRMICHGLAFLTQDGRIPSDCCNGSLTKGGDKKEPSRRTALEFQQGGVKRMG